MTDRYGVPLVRNLEETAGYGIGYVSYDYPNPVNNKTIQPKLLRGRPMLTERIMLVQGRMQDPGWSTHRRGSGRPPARTLRSADLTSFVKNGVTYARANGKEKALSAFNDPKGQFADGELTMIAVDYNGTVLANGITPQTANEHINLVNYHDPDGVTTVREMRDLSRQGGGFSYTVATVTKDHKTYYAPKIDYAEPVDSTYWIFSGIIVPEYEQLREGNLTGITVRNHTRTDLYDLVDRSVASAKGKREGKNTCCDQRSQRAVRAGGSLCLGRGLRRDGPCRSLLEGRYRQELPERDRSQWCQNHAGEYQRHPERGVTGFTHVMFPGHLREEQGARAETGVHEAGG